MAAPPTAAQVQQLHRELRACRKEAHKGDAEFGAAGMEETAVNTEGVLKCNVDFCRAESRLGVPNPTHWCAKPKYK